MIATVWSGEVAFTSGEFETVHLSDQKGSIDLKPGVVFDKPQFAEFVIDARAWGSGQFVQHFLGHFREKVSGMEHHFDRRFASIGKVG